MRLQDVFTGQLSTKDWLRIVHALKSYVIAQEEILRTKNVGDREWQELQDYSALARDIEYYILSLDKTNE